MNNIQRFQKVNLILGIFWKFSSKFPILNELHYTVSKTQQKKQIDIWLISLMRVISVYIRSKSFFCLGKCTLLESNYL